MQSKEPINPLQVALLGDNGVVRHTNCSKVFPIKLQIKPRKQRFRICRSLIHHLTVSSQARVIVSQWLYTRQSVAPIKCFCAEHCDHITKEQTQSISLLPVGTFPVFKLFNYLKVTFPAPLKSRMLIINLRFHKKYLPIAALMKNIYRKSGWVSQYPYLRGNQLLAL